MKKFWVKLTLVITVLLGFGLPNQAMAASTIDVNARAALAIDAKTGQVLYAKNADQALPIASMTKMVGIYLVLDAVKSGKLSWDQEVAVDALSYRISQNTNLSNVPLRSDGKYTVKALYQAALISSANAAMMLLGDALSGNQAQFITAMQNQLHKWGIQDATIVNSTGLNNSELGQDIVAGTGANAENSMSARSVAIVAQHLITDFPEVLQTTKIPKLKFASGNSDNTMMENFNHMLPGLSSYDASLPVDGLKTGTTDLAGANFTGTVEKNGLRLITVVMHANGPDHEVRFSQTAQLMKYVYGEYVPVAVFKAGTSAGPSKQIAVKRGTQEHVAIAPAKSMTIYLPKSATQVQYQYTAAKKQLSAPETAGTRVGTLSLAGNASYLTNVSGQRLSVPMATQKTVKKTNVFVLIWRGIVEFFSNLF
ncbi:serine hydrolase [Lacticaseibacillus brantae]|uniref:serine-type D-Ala-D-Ala carboxypeptidase n=1 Tax=Lacticaseibacillus brantae DSM 23927 TaxID=1423727 RepID=A0A0R2B8B2_9LACO|nr:serine hydrolase [Lacticaseibacillus brantae]KRM71772.1 D-alanyl-D-alanine carboxypeptidase [Lacticaseibacillus brantae DSM 23927]